MSRLHNAPAPPPALVESPWVTAARPLSPVVGGEGSGGWHPVRRCARQVKGGGAGARVSRGYERSPAFNPASGLVLNPALSAGHPGGHPRTPISQISCSLVRADQAALFEGHMRRTSPGGRVWYRPEVKFPCSGPRGPSGLFLRGTCVGLRPGAACGAARRSNFRALVRADQDALFCSDPLAGPRGPPTFPSRSRASRARWNRPRRRRRRDRIEHLPGPRSAASRSPSPLLG